ncbi:MCE family protein [Antrihabitans sp. YC2-6]|uniref:MCE family protein n=1 Tax=Antrihabitans sp. YC2-6 TaxID=2799498 RepID=UPI0018F6D5F4|nr:MCE family protein [Antrihabitans sp. YC2-6]MBJ8346491.1 MCE family protein [Antrihabitans sp. YC2-6]
MTFTRSSKVAALVLVAGISATGCGLTVDSLPLPKPGVDGDAYEVKAEFDNALNLPADAKVKVNGSDIGVVTAISTKDFKANVTMEIESVVELPSEGTRAELRQATPLGDVFIAISFDKLKPGEELLKDGGTITKTSAGATVEQLLMSATTLINGGALTEAARIMSEVSSMVSGRGPTIQHLIQKLTSVVGTLNERTDALDGTLKQTDTLLATLNQRSDDLGRIADSIPSMISVLAQNNATIGDLLAKTAEASSALGDFANTSGDQLNDLLGSVDNVMTGITGWQDKLEQFGDIVHTLTPKINSATRAGAINSDLIIDSLSIGPLWDSGSRWPDLSDVNALVVSLTEVLGHVYQRITTGGN